MRDYNGCCEPDCCCRDGRGSNDIIWIIIAIIVICWLFGDGGLFGGGCC